MDDDEELLAALVASEAEYHTDQAAMNAGIFASFNDSSDSELSDEQVAEEMYMAQLEDASSLDEILARSMAQGSSQGVSNFFEEDARSLAGGGGVPRRVDTTLNDEMIARSLADGDDNQQVDTFMDEIIARTLAGGENDQVEVRTLIDEEIARTLAGGEEEVSTINDEELARSLAEAFNDEEMDFISLFLMGDDSQGMDTTDDEAIARSLAGGGGSQEIDTLHDQEMARMMYQAQENEEGSEDAIAKAIAENAKLAKQRDEPPPPPLEGGLGNLANHTQNVHVSAEEQPAMRTVEELMQRPLPPQMGPREMIQELHQQISRPDLTCAPVHLLQDAQQGALAVLASPDQLQVRCNRSQRVFEGVLVAVWNVIRSHKDKDEMIRRLAEEIHEGVGQCNTGRVTRLVNALRGFVDIGGQDVAQVTPLSLTLS